jgi:hypothetical protein
MFAAVDMTVSDALITAWRAKLFYGIWRPSTANQLGDTDGNPATTADPTWTPLLVNPPYPDYVSGYNAVPRLPHARWRTSSAAGTLISP